MLKKKDLVRQISRQTGASKRVSTIYLNAIIEVMRNALIEGEGISLMNLGKFEVREVAPRAYVHPATGEKIEKPATRKVVFRPTDNFKADFFGKKESEDVENE